MWVNKDIAIRRTIISIKAGAPLEPAIKAAACAYGNNVTAIEIAELRELVLAGLSNTAK